MHRTALALPAGLAAAGALALAASGCGSTTPSSAATNPATTQAPPAAPATPRPGGPVAVRLTEFAVAASPASALAGKVTFKVTNAGKAPHELVVLRTRRPAGSLGKPGAARIAESGHVGEVGDLAPGASKTLVLRLKPGHYSLVCNLPGHYAGGMHADFTVR